MLTVKSIMTFEPTTTSATAKIWEAANTMLDRHVSGLPVVDDDGHIEGVISDSDFLRRVEIHTEPTQSSWRRMFAARGVLAAEYVKAFGQSVGEVMSAPAITVTPDTTVTEAALLMAHHNIKRVPVVDDGRLVGIVARSDIMAGLISELPHFSAARKDANIKGALEAELARYSWGGGITLEVADGVVALNGWVFDANEKIAARVAAENIAMVTRVDDHLTVPEKLEMPAAPPGFLL